MQIQGKLSHWKIYIYKKKTSLAVQWLRILTAADTNSQIPAQGTKIPECMPGGVAKKKKKYSHSSIHLEFSFSVFSFPSPRMI